MERVNGDTDSETDLTPPPPQVTEKLLNWDQFFDRKEKRDLCNIFEIKN